MVQQLSDIDLWEKVGAYVARNSTGQNGMVHSGMYIGQDTSMYPEEAVVLLRELHRRNAHFLVSELERDCVELARANRAKRQHRTAFD